MNYIAFILNNICFIIVIYIMNFYLNGDFTDFFHITNIIIFIISMIIGLFFTSILSIRKKSFLQIFKFHFLSIVVSYMHLYFLMFLMIFESFGLAALTLNIFIIFSMMLSTLVTVIMCKKINIIVITQ